MTNSFPYFIKNKPILDLSGKKLLVISPHMDDEIIGCYSLLSDLNIDREVLFTTDSNFNNDGYIRRKETINVMKKLKIKNFYFFDLPDSQSDEIFLEYSNFSFSKYDVLLVPNPNDRHIDHAAVYKNIKFLKENGNIIPEIIFYKLVDPLCNPTHYIEIKNINDKKETLKLYASQNQPFFMQNFIRYDRYCGFMNKVEYAEEFKLEEKE